MPSRRYSFGNADLHALDGLSDRGLVVRHRAIDRGGVLGIVPGHRAHQDRGVARGARDRPRLVERGCERHDAPARAAAVGRLDAHGRGERCRLADRAAGIGRGRAHAEQRRHGGRRSAGRAARHQRGVGTFAPPRIDHRAEARGLVRRAHREFVVVELAEHHGAVAPELRGHGGFVRRHEIAEDLRARRGAHVLGREQVLDPQRNAGQRTALALGDLRVDRRAPWHAPGPAFPARKH